MRPSPLRLVAASWRLSVEGELWLAHPEDVMPLGVETTSLNPRWLPAAGADGRLRALVSGMRAGR